MSEALRRIKRFFVGGHPLAKSRTAKGYTLLRLGSLYGGWTFVDEPELLNSLVLSAGLGEDASFDIEFARKYNAKIILVDPTPRAITHYHEIVRRLGSPKTHRYVRGGRQPATAYPLEALRQSQLHLIDKALWDANGTLRFFAPRNPAHVSHSLVDYQNSYKQDSDHIVVSSCRASELLAELGKTSKQIQLIKLDIEGAEIEVLRDLLETGFRPKQILVEFDDIHSRSDWGAKRVDAAHAGLRKAGYKLIYTNGIADFLYYRN